MGPETTCDLILVIMRRENAVNKIRRSIAKNLQQVTWKISSANKKTGDLIPRF